MSLGIDPACWRDEALNTRESLRLCAGRASFSIPGHVPYAESPSAMTKISFKNLFRRVKSKMIGEVPAFVILLERDEERRSHVHQNVVPRLPICRIISATDAEKGEVDKFFHAEKIVVGSNYTDSTPGKLACSISHIRTWKEIVVQNLAHAIVLEDDIAILDGFSSYIRSLVRQLPTDYDLVHLYVSEDRSEWLSQVENEKGAYVNYIPVWGRSAYLLSRSGAKKLLLDFQTITNHGDFQIREMAQKGKLLVYCVAESYIDNLGQSSSQYSGEQFKSNVYPVTNTNRMGP
jgi:GR25 family glycosyltransferase involved in LPS biosynthesis